MTDEDIPDGHKRCSKCKEVKTLDRFHRRAASKDGLFSRCKSCVSENNKARYARPETKAKHKVLRDRWRAENPDYFREHYLENRERKLAQVAEYTKANPPDPERQRRNARAWHQANRDRRRELRRAWEANNAEKVREKRRRDMSRRRARLRNLPSERYTLNDLLERDGTACVLCGGELDLDAAWPEPLAPSVEHLECLSWPDATAGDVLTNVAVSHFDCNNKRRANPHPAAAAKREQLLREAQAG